MKTKVCAKAGCGRTAVPGKNYCSKHLINQPQQQRKVFTRRGKSSQWHHLYETPEWRRRRSEFLKKYPYCFICGKPATIADHIIPHRGNLELFYSDENLQPMCQSCHSRKTMRENGNFNQKPPGV